MSLIDEIERIGERVQFAMGAEYVAAVRELCDLFEQHPAGRGIDEWSARELLDDWRNVRRRFEAIRYTTPGELRQLRAIARIEGQENLRDNEPAAEPAGATTDGAT